MFNLWPKNEVKEIIDNPNIHVDFKWYKENQIYGKQYYIKKGAF